MRYIWEFVKKIGRFFDRLMPGVVVDFMKGYPGLTVAVGIGVALLWGTLQRGLMLIGL